ncbi:MAG: hypothetical protein J6W07_06645, partial [Bacteroidales bacterium]|nr:hypothetical protein [Bacteroidales bacterium]
MKKSIIILTALALVAAGCAKQETLVEEVCTPAVKGTYHAAIAGFQDKVLSKDGKESSGVPTKTYIDGAQNRMYWEKEDCISLFKTTVNVPYMNLNATG